MKRNFARREGVGLSNTPLFRTSVPGIVKAERPARPLYIVKTNVMTEIVRRFMTRFQGQSLYAVKTNPDPFVLQTLWDAGVRDFDVASMEEVEIVASLLPAASLYFMHPVKSPEAIHSAYHDYGVRHFTVDCEDELYKIMREVGFRGDIGLHVRLALPTNHAASIDFSAKFGAWPDKAAALLGKCRSVCEHLGVSFHVGTQTTDPHAYERAIRIAAGVIRDSGVSVDVLNVGGGFAVPYEGQCVPEIEAYVDVIDAAIIENNLSNLILMAEPGRHFVAQSGSLIVRVELRKGQMLYINDGTYGGLFDAGPMLETPFPVQAIRADGHFETAMSEFQMTGPTCDSLDMMDGPFILPNDIRMGDWIEVQNIGAYSQSIRSNFNGFGAHDLVGLSQAV